jgi:hypothetical protein
VGTGIEGVTSRTNVHLQIGNGAADFDFVPAVAGGGGVHVFGVNAFFHKCLVYYKSGTQPESRSVFALGRKTENCLGIEGFSMAGKRKSRGKSPSKSP